MKAKPAKKQRPERSSRKKLRFEDGVRAALIASAVICAAVLGAGGFFALRSALTGGQPALSQAEESAETAPYQAAPETEAAPAVPETAQQAPALSDPYIDQIIRDLEAAGTGAAASPNTAPAQPGDGTPPPGVSSAAPTQPGVPNAGTVQPGAVNANPPGLPPIRPGTSGRKGTLVLVIDDAGNNLRELEPFLTFPGPLTIAVLPGLPNSVEAARRVRASAGKELFLHQPMEPLNGQDPGPGAVKTGMSPAAIKEIIVKNLNEIGPVTGFNNHEGSRATMDKAIMRPVLELSRDSALVFLDSRTTADTAAPALARELGLAIAQRDIFLDNEQDRDSILAALEAGCKRAEQNGSAILIGHTWSPRLAAILTEMYPRLAREGFFFTTVSGLMQRGK